jgi:hypothetical protein
MKDKAWPRKSRGHALHSGLFIAPRDWRAARE